MPYLLGRRLFRNILQGLALFIIAVPTLADSVNSTQRTVTKLADGVYEIRHKDGLPGNPQGNTTVIIGEREVFVVDSCWLPSSAREDIAQIKQWTDKPVRYLLNTHWHYDHTLGNGAYRDAFPGLAIIAHAEARKAIKGYAGPYLEDFLKTAASYEQMLDTGKSPDGSALREGVKSQLKELLPTLKTISTEFEALRGEVPKLIPDLTFERELDVNIGNREVQLKYFGRGNTAGDAIVYLPKEKILITGDLVDHPVPYLFGGFPAEEITTLEKMAQLDAETIVPGHGDVMHDKVYLHQEIGLLKTVVSQMEKEVYLLGGTIAKDPDTIQKAVRNDIDFKALRRQFAGDDPDNGQFFDDSVGDLLKYSYWQQD